MPMLRKLVYPKIEGVLNLTAGWLNRKGFSPNQLTLAGVVLNLGAGLLYATGWIMAGGIIVIVAGMSDMLDGALARISSRVTRFGAFLDSVTDRYSDFFLFGGLSLYFARQGHAGYLILSLLIIAGSYGVSYSKARAENFIPHCGVGLFDRGLRTVLLIAGSIIPPIFYPVLWILALGSNATAIYRILYTRKVLLAKKD